MATDPPITWVHRRWYACTRHDYRRIVAAPQQLVCVGLMVAVFSPCFVARRISLSLNLRNVPVPPGDCRMLRTKAAPLIAKVLPLLFGAG